MPRNSILFEEFRGTSCTELSDQLKKYFADCPAPAADVDGHEHDFLPHVRRFLLFWGPPGDFTKDVQKLRDSLPEDCPGIGCSRIDAFGPPNVIDKREADWTATLVESPYVEATASFASLNQAAGDSLDVERIMSHFKDGLDADYFNGGQPHRAEKNAPHSVRYRRPAVLLLFLPGMGGDPTKPWPVSNHDYEIIEAVSVEVSHSVGVFGASAVSNWPRDRDTEIPDSWVAVVEAGQATQFLVDGFVGLLVKTDLAFGLASSHEFQTGDGKHSVVVERVDDGTRAPGLISPQNWPDRFHSVFLSKGRVPSLPDPATANTRVPRRHSKDLTTRILVQCELNEVIPNPAYKLTSGATKSPPPLSFLRAVANGTPLYVAEGNRRSIVDAVPAAIERACRYGDIHDIQAIFVANCRGRRDILGQQDALRDEWKVLDKKKLTSGRIFGLYGDGETCSAASGRPLHRNWTVATLVWGGRI